MFIIGVELLPRPVCDHVGRDVQDVYKRHHARRPALLSVVGCSVDMLLPRVMMCLSLNMEFVTDEPP